MTNGLDPAGAAKLAVPVTATRLAVDALAVTWVRSADPATALTVRLPVIDRVPIVPGAPPRRAAPALTVVAPPTVPVPPRIAPAFTVTAPAPVPDPARLLTSNVPAFTVVPPE